MLEIDHGQKLIDDLWQATPAKVELPESLKAELYGPQELAPAFHDNRRTYHRYYMRGKAVLKRGPAMFGVFTKDVSRQGVAFLSPVALLPKERVKLSLPVAELTMEVTRCKRVDQKCFECGAKFIV